MLGLLCVIMTLGSHTCISSAGGPLRGHAVSLQVCVCDGQQVVVAEAAAESRLGVQQSAGVTAGEGHAHVIVGGRQTLLDRSGAG